MLNDAIQIITSIAALVLGLSYVVGGLIVNLYLSRYGITEYQVVRIKYLVVGLIYAANSTAIIAASICASIFFFAGSENILTRYYLGLFIISLVALVILITLSIFSKRIRRRVRSTSLYWTIFTTLAILSTTYPTTIAIRQLIIKQIVIADSVYIGSALLIAVLSIISQIYFYATYIYGNSDALDHIGMGILIPIKLAASEDNITLLKQMGISAASPNITDKVLLIDETDSQYIVGVGRDMDKQIFKINKELIKGMIYLQESVQDNKRVKN